MPINRMVENDRRRDALWAPFWDTGNALASSPPEHRAWGAVTVGGAAGDRRARGHASVRGARGWGRSGRGPTGWRGRDPGKVRGSGARSGRQGPAVGGGGLRFFGLSVRGEWPGGLAEVCQPELGGASPRCTSADHPMGRDSCTSVDRTPSTTTWRTPAPTSSSIASGLPAALVSMLVERPSAMLGTIRARTASFARRQGRRAGVDQIASIACSTARDGASGVR
jgi:hypothetical protein